jgi:hypothetical protein
MKKTEKRRRRRRRRKKMGAHLLGTMVRFIHINAFYFC